MIPNETNTQYWIIVASRDHVMKGVAGSFAQANHGKRSPLRRMQQGDWVIYYSAKQRLNEAEPCQAFTAVGRFVDDEIYTHDMGEGFMPSRRKVAFLPCQEVPIRPLIPVLSFIPDKQHWGAPFRYGVLEIPQDDFQRIADQMLPNGIASLQ